MISKMFNTIMKHNMVSPGDRVLAGVSGGPDSVALLHGLYILQDRLKIKVYAAHLDHRFRGEESFEDARFVEDFCRRLGVPCIKEAVDVPAYIEKTGLSPEEAAREVRYDFFDRAASKVDAAKIALGHNLDDQAETVMMRVLRGTGLKGLQGIEPVRDGRFIRPLIEISRSEIEAYLDLNGLGYRTDSTNLKPEYHRNRIRLELLPLLEREYNPNIKRVLAGMAEILGWDVELLEDLAEAAYNEAAHDDNGQVFLSLDRLVKAPRAISSRMIRRACGQVVHGLKDIELVHVKQVMAFLQSPGRGPITQLPRGLTVEKRGGCLVFSKGRAAPAPKFEYILAIPGSVTIPEAGYEIRAEIVPRGEEHADLKPGILMEHLDFDKINASRLVVRNRRSGDRFVPLGVNGSKKLKDFFIDEKVPGYLRDEIPLVTDGHDILWVVGYRMSGSHRVTGDTRRLLRLTARRLEEST